MTFEQAVQTIKNNVLSGIQAKTPNANVNTLQIEEDAVVERVSIMNEMYLKNILPINSLYVPFHAAILDEKDMTNSNRVLGSTVQSYKHFKIPAIVNSIGPDAIYYIGTVDMEQEFKVFVNKNWSKRKHRIVKNNRPFVVVDAKYVDKNGMIDCYVINAPMIDTLSVIMIPQDLRNVDDEVHYSITVDDYHDKSEIMREVVKRLSERYIRYYRQGYQPDQPTQSNK